MSLSCSRVLNLTPGRRLVDRRPKYRPGASSVERCEHAPRCQAILPADRASVPGRPPGCLIADARVRNNRHGRVGRGGREEQPRDARKSRHPQRRAGKIPGRLRGRRRKCVGRVRERRSDAAGRLELPFQVAHPSRSIPKARGGLHVPTYHADHRGGRTCRRGSRRHSCEPKSGSHGKHRFDFLWLADHPFDIRPVSIGHPDP